MSLFITLADFLSRDANGTILLPAHWVCPIQQGLPIFLNTAKEVLLYMAAFSFLTGIISSTFAYLFAFGNEEGAKKAQKGAKWTFIGALIIMLSAYMITWYANLLLEPTVLPIKIFEFRRNTPLIPINGSASSQCVLNDEDLGSTDSFIGESVNLPQVTR